jgi:hypothetical protein
MDSEDDGRRRYSSSYTPHGTFACGHCCPVHCQWISADSVNAFHLLKIITPSTTSRKYYQTRRLNGGVMKSTSYNNLKGLV